MQPNVSGKLQTRYQSASATYVLDSLQITGNHQVIADLSP